jgi:hypothetical protein
VAVAEAVFGDTDHQKRQQRQGGDQGHHPNDPQDAEQGGK